MESDQFFASEGSDGKRGGEGVAAARREEKWQLPSSNASTAREGEKKKRKRGENHPMLGDGLGKGDEGPGNQRPSWPCKGRKKRRKKKERAAARTEEWGDSFS